MAHVLRFAVVQSVVVLREASHMFGMDDPAKVVVQIRSYIEEGRYEIAEVMAQEL